MDDYYRKNPQMCHQTSPVVRYNINPCSKDATVLKRLVLSTISETQISKIECVTNVFLNRAYEIRLAEIRFKNPFGRCQVELLLHATTIENVESILRDNLNWRLVKRHKYGVGVSFSDDPEYANKYCNNRGGNSRAFIVCEVIVNNVNRVADNGDKVPSDGIDTYRSTTGKVFVKFDDFMFVPRYMIYYYRQQIIRPLVNNRQNMTTSQITIPTVGCDSVDNKRNHQAIKPQPILVMPDPLIRSYCRDNSTIMHTHHTTRIHVTDRMIQPQLMQNAIQNDHKTQVKQNKTQIEQTDRMTEPQLMQNAIQNDHKTQIEQTDRMIQQRPMRNAIQNYERNPDVRQEMRNPPAKKRLCCTIL